MMISITTIADDTDNARIIRQDPQTEITNNRGGRRVSRTATLDGAATIDDRGYSPADRTYLVRTRDNISAWVENLVRNHTQIRLSTKNGVFLGVPSRWWNINEYTHLEVIITEEIK